ncbi:MAG TPA: hypothetical protein VHC18_20805 [Amycolatopsis sp.]|nr:hypothetical protein [Amycolatopsis sp.]
MLELGLNGKRAIVPRAGGIPERTGHGRIAGRTFVVDGGATPIAPGLVETNSGTGQILRPMARSSIPR